MRHYTIILPSANGTTQIDHLIISIYGLFIIETKNRKGWIFGSKEKSKWTQIIFSQKYSFQNPLHQTFRQKKVLAEFLKINESKIFSVVYFNGNCSFKTSLPDNVIKSRLGKYIKNFRTAILTSRKVDNVVFSLDQQIDKYKLNSQDHMKSLNNRINSDSICPKCGSNLVLRTRKNNNQQGLHFLGCESYPKCRFTKNIKK